ncbi:MAG: hypothetical protein HFE77_06945 [Clostridiales bacterium]|nr:hypothetical protein [Clostridiales bacterium]
MIQGIQITPGYGIGRALILQPLTSYPALLENTVLIAKHFEDIEKAAQKTKYVSGMVLENQTELSAFRTLACHLSVPAIAGAQGACNAIYTGEPVIVDGEAGIVIINPDLDTEKDYLTLQYGLPL